MKTRLLLLFVLITGITYGQNKGMFFDASSRNYIRAPHHSSYYPNNNFTIEFWMKIDRQSEIDMTLLNKGTCISSNTMFSFILRPDSMIAIGFNCTGNCANQNSFLCNTKIQNGLCYHVAITYSSPGPKLYLNGVQQTLSPYPGATYCGNLYPSTEPMRIGVYRYVADTLGQFYDGMLDEIRMWNHVRTLQEIQTYAQEELTGYESGLLLYYKFLTGIAGNGSTVVNDAIVTGSALNGTLFSENTVSPYTDNSCFIYTSIEDDAIKENYVSLFPNPVNNGQLFLRADNPDDYIDNTNINITDISGREVATYTAFDFSGPINIAHLDEGLYFLNLTKGDIQIALRFVKK